MLQARTIRIGVKESEVHAGSHAESDSHSMHAGMHHAMGQPSLLETVEAYEASGTAWQPAATPMHGRHGSMDGWRLMGHGVLFFGYDEQGGDRGDGQFLSTNWLMGMARHPLLGGEFLARSMLSLEPLTVDERGYPLLLQTGESFEGQPLHDQQHPHDLFMELAAIYARPLTANLGLQLYGALAGEPALGPVAFPHRRSASADPLAPLGHHWQDSTHISFGVLSAGLFTQSVKLEGSWFNGREPDEHRYDLDLRGFDSFSGRLLLNPNRNWSLQASYGYLESPESLEPQASLHRTTVSAMHANALGTTGECATSLVWGSESRARPLDECVAPGKHRRVRREEHRVRPVRIRRENRRAARAV
jgi:hypothetical protein